MKKTFKTFALMLAAVLAFSSCADIPAPYNMPEKNGNTGENTSGTVIEPTGDGTAASPYNIAKLKELIDASEVPTGEIYIKGVISQIKSLKTAQYTRAQYYISDDGKTNNQFYVYNGLYLNGENFTSDDQIKVGDKVVILGTLGTYNGSYQVAQNSKIVSLNDSGSVTPPSGEAKGSGTEADPYNTIAAIQFAQSLGADVESENNVYVSGIISSIKYTYSSNFGTATYNISADGKPENEFVVYGSYYFNNQPWKDGDTQIKVGDAVVVCGKVVNYKGNTPEFANKKNWLVSINGGSGQGGDEPGPGPEPGGDAEHITVAEFLQRADENTVYELTGTVKNISNTTYGNFDLVEGDASIYIFGLLNQNGEKQKFAAIGIEEGDVVTLTGKYKLYKNKPEIADAQLVSFTKGQGGDEPGPGPEPGGDPVTDLVNGNFENWDNASQPTGWKSASTASSAELAQSTDAHGGSYACIVKAPGTMNKRLATQEMTLEAGTYTFSFYAKSTTADVSQTRGGYVILVNGEAPSNGYHYGGYTDLNNNGWTQISYDFTLESETTVCLLVMNPKNSDKSKSQDILVDDATLVKK